MLLRSVERGELRASIHVEMAIDLLPAPLYWCIVISRRQADPAYVERLLGVTLSALKAC